MSSIDPTPAPRPPQAPIPTPPPATPTVGARLAAWAKAASAWACHATLVALGWLWKGVVWLWGLRPSLETIQGYLSPSELLRAVVSGVVTGGGLAAVLQSLSDNAVRIFPDSNVAQIFAAAMVALQAWRFFNHGSARVVKESKVPVAIVHDRPHREP